MKVAVISRNERFWATRMILKAVRTAGQAPVFLRTDQIRLVVGIPAADATSEGTSLMTNDVFIPRIGRSMTDFGKMLLQQLEILGLPATLSGEALTVARNKFLALQALHKAGVPVPRTALLASRPSRFEAKTLVPYPAVLKILSGTQGIGVMRVRDRDETASIVDTLNMLGEIVCLQEFIPNPGIDIRAFVVDDEVVASMKRVAPSGEWRANIHLGAKGLPIELDDHVKRIAIRASKAVGLEISGVDLIMNRDEPYVLEVNASPGFRGLLQATGVNAADAIVDYAVRKAETAPKLTA